MSNKSRNELIAFTLIVFAMLWIPAWIFIALSKQASGVGSEYFGSDISIVGFIVLGSYSPSLAGILLTVWREGWAGLLIYLRRVFHWRVGVRWWAIAIFSIPIATLLVSAVGASLGYFELDLSLWYITLPLLLANGFILTDSGALGEEFGLRGYALPRMLEGWTPFTASLVMAIVWAIWHLPAFFLPGQSHTEWSIWIFLLVSIGLCIFMTFIYINTSGSVLLSGFIPHMMVNSMNGSGIWTGVDVWALFALSGLGGVCLYVGRKKFFIKGSVLEVHCDQRGAQEK